MASVEVETNCNNSLMEGSDSTGESPPTKVSRSSQKNGKWQGYDAKRVFKPEWLTMYKWLASDPNNPNLAICKICNRKIRAHKGDIEKHQRTRRHLKKQTNHDILAELIPNTTGDGSGDEMDASVYNQTKNSGIDSSIVENIDNFVDYDGAQQMVYFTDSAPNVSQQNTNLVIDKLVEKYHQQRIKYLKEEHESALNIDTEKFGILRQQLENEATFNETKNALLNEQHEHRLKLSGVEHVAKMKSIDELRDAKLRIIENELIFSKQEYEKKMQLLDAQLHAMRETNISSTVKQGEAYAQLMSHSSQAAAMPTNQYTNMY